MQSVDTSLRQCKVLKTCILRNCGGEAQQQWRAIPHAASQDYWRWQWIHRRLLLRIMPSLGDRDRVDMRRTLKFLHTLGAIGLTGALAAQIVLLSQLPAPGSLPEYAALRGAMGTLAEWILLPSLGITLVSGLLSMSITPAFHNAGWAWLKLLLGVSMFEGTLITVQGPAQKEAQLSAQALAGDIDPALLGQAMQAEWNSVWVVLAIAIVNVVLGVWQPRFQRRRRSAA